MIKRQTKGIPNKLKYKKEEVKEQIWKICKRVWKKDGWLKKWRIWLPNSDTQQFYFNVKRVKTKLKKKKLEKKTKKIACSLMDVAMRRAPAQVFPLLPTQYIQIEHLPLFKVGVKDTLCFVLLLCTFSLARTYHSALFRYATRYATTKQNLFFPTSFTPTLQHSV